MGIPEGALQFQPIVVDKVDWFFEFRINFERMLLKFWALIDFKNKHKRGNSIDYGGLHTIVQLACYLKCRGTKLLTFFTTFFQRLISTSIEVWKRQ